MVFHEKEASWFASMHPSFWMPVEDHQNYGYMVPLLEELLEPGHVVAPEI